MSKIIEKCYKHDIHTIDKQENKDEIEFEIKENDNSNDNSNNNNNNNSNNNNEADDDDADIDMTAVEPVAPVIPRDSTNTTSDLITTNDLLRSINNASNVLPTDDIEMTNDNNNTDNSNSRRGSRRLDESERGPLPKAKRTKLKESGSSWMLPVVPTATEYGDEVFTQCCRLITHCIHNGVSIGVGKLFHEFGITSTFIKLINKVC